MYLYLVIIYSYHAVNVDIFIQLVVACLIRKKRQRLIYNNFKYLSLNSNPMQIKSVMKGYWQSNIILSKLKVFLLFKVILLIDSTNF